MSFSRELRELFLMQQAYATLFSIVNKLQIEGDKRLENLTSRQFMTIMSILHLPEDETTLNNIAKKLGTSKQNVSKLVTSIEKKGYIVTTPSVRDKRAINVKITESVKKVILASNEKMIFFLADIFNDFTSEEMETLWGLLKKLYRFDGEEQDDFEENISITVDIPIDYEIGVLKELSRRRNR